MNYLEVKLEEIKEIEIDHSTFISDIIKQQDSLGRKVKNHSFKKEELLALGFNHNATTNGFSMQKEFTLEELIKLAKEISLLKDHILTHGFLVLKIYENELYFWDTSLIFEGVDTFKYCLEYHNTYKLDKLNVLTNSDSINEELLSLVKYTSRYSEPTLEFITNSYKWDKKKGTKVLKASISNMTEYISIKEVKEY
jgi:hypothetical protein